MIAHLAMPPADTPLPQNVRAQDTNGNGQIELAEAQGNLKAQFDLYDADRNGALSGAEVTRGPLAYVLPPSSVYTDRITLTLGGKRAEVISIPTPHADDNTIVRFVDGTNVLFASDWITVQRLPFGGDVALKDEIARTKMVEAMDFEHFICSHGMLGKKADVDVEHPVSRGTQGRSRQGDRRRTDVGAGAGERADGRLQRLGVLRTAAPSQRGRHLSGAHQQQVRAAQASTPISCRGGLAGRRGSRG